MSKSKNNKPKMLYLHGFASGFNPNSWKVKKFKKYYDVLPFTYDSSKTYQECFKKMCDFIDNNEVSVISGFSLGGYFAVNLSAKYNKFCISLNPSGDPQVDLRKFLGKVEVLKSKGESITFTEDLLLSYPTISKGGHGIVLLKRQDTYTRSDLTSFMLSNKFKQIIVEGKDHSIRDIEKYMPIIRKEHIKYNKDLHLQKLKNKNINSNMFIEIGVER